MALRLLRGRVMIRPEQEKPSLIVHTPEPGRDNRNSLGIGVVLAMGPPALTPMRWAICDECRGSGAGPWGPATDLHAGTCRMCAGKGGSWRGGVEIPPEFKVGDRVRFIGQHESRLGVWDGEEVRFCAQEEVQAVIE